MASVTNSNPSRFQRLTVALPRELRETISHLAHETSLPESRIVVELVGRALGKKSILLPTEVLR